MDEALDSPQPNANDAPVTPSMAPHDEQSIAQFRSQLFAEHAGENYPKCEPKSRMHARETLYRANVNLGLFQNKKKMANGHLLPYVDVRYNKSVVEVLGNSISDALGTSQGTDAGWFIEHTPIGGAFL